MELLFEIRPGQEVEVKEIDLRLKLVSVDDDSRCPVGVNCVWAGNVRIILSLSPGESAGEQTSLNTALDPQVVRLRGQRITIRKVTPPRVVNETIKPDDYVITLAVTSEQSGDVSEG